PARLTDPVELLVAEFVEYLVRERGLRDGSQTVWEYRRTARLFLTGRLAPDAGGLDGVTAADVTGFVLAECRGRSRRMSVALVSTLRGLLVPVPGGADPGRSEQRGAQGCQLALRVAAEGASRRARGADAGEL